jgi:hypothetical protein
MKLIKKLLIVIIALSLISCDKHDVFMPKTDKSLSEEKPVNHDENRRINKDKVQ